MMQFTKYILRNRSDVMRSPRIKTYVGREDLDYVL